MRFYHLACPPHILHYGLVLFQAQFSISALIDESITDINDNVYLRNKRASDAYNSSYFPPYHAVKTKMEELNVQMEIFKRGLYARPYVSYFAETADFMKPFVDRAKYIIDHIQAWRWSPDEDRFSDLSQGVYDISKYIDWKCYRPEEDVTFNLMDYTLLLGKTYYGHQMADVDRDHILSETSKAQQLLKVMIACYSVLPDMLQDLGDTSSEAINKLNTEKQRMRAELSLMDTYVFDSLSEEVAFYSDLVTGYSHNNYSMIYIASLFTGDKIKQSLINLDMIPSMIGDDIMQSMSTFIQSLKSTLIQVYMDTLKSLADNRDVFDTGLAEYLAREMSIWREPYADYNTLELIQYRMKKGSSMSSWSNQLSLESFVYQGYVSESLENLVGGYLEDVMVPLRSTEKNIQHTVASVINQINSLEKQMSVYEEENTMGRQFIL